MLALSIIIVFLILILSVGSEVLSIGYAYFPEQPDDRYKTFLAASGTIVGLFSVAAALLTFALSGVFARRAQRKQHTITVLLETRLSSEFQKTMEKRRYKFPEYTDVKFEDWDSARTCTAANPDDIGLAEDTKRQRESALALTQLLNYYEFLAVGITEGDLDKAMLRKTIRSIMCNLVDDCRDLIAGMQRTNPSTYEHLTALYNEWRKEGALDINGEPNERPIPKLVP